ncbi:MAG TPA: hypothetical protein VEX38_07975 [Fimbriimonadaceae bacterium]|nr:hypothetical protein [Fimbriimonadaceae bacterium]
MNDGSWKVEIAAKTSEELAAIRSLRTKGYGRRRTVSFAYRDDAFPAEVEEVTARSTGANPVLTVSLKPATPRSDYMLDMAHNGIAPEQMAERRARLLLLGEKPSARGTARDDLLPSMVLGPLKDLGVTGAVLPALRKGWKGSPGDFLRHARLRLAYYLHAGAVCDDLFELKLGPERDGGLAVHFRGRRKGRYSGDQPQEIRVEGICRL